eukprot:CAMPEP_0168610270 /NCGR_PEP_ID=MMETSP0449_2-20121227/1692_1 /TAXON_ID=1082188 /ORGANISM="Strombidium rassoulzadegani, Strain ras09" /LENGTH=93 /DNA_ID=CAMNT_0008650553 /DNA_START=410 /DNA_END=691 /DNA_ORIENTATION=-
MSPKVDGEFDYLDANREARIPSFILRRSLLKKAQSQVQNSAQIRMKLIQDGNHDSREDEGEEGKDSSPNKDSNDVETATSAHSLPSLKSGAQK